MTFVTVDEIQIKMFQYTKPLSVMNIFLCVLLLFQSLTIIAVITWSVTYITPRLYIYDWPRHLLTLDELKYRKPIDNSFESKQKLRLDNSTRTFPDTKNVVSTSGIITSDLSVTILATFNDGFVDFLCNWLKSLSRLNIHYNITLIAEDATAFQKFFKVKSAYQTNMSIKLYYTNSRFVEKALPGANTPQYRAIVCKRPRYILDVLSTEQDVLFVDIDAVWFRNPLSLIASQYHEYDIWVATGFDGVTPCPCFLYLKSNNASINLVNDWLKRVTRNQCYTNVHAENEMTALGKGLRLGLGVCDSVSVLDSRASDSVSDSEGGDSTTALALFRKGHCTSVVPRYFPFSLLVILYAFIEEMIVEEEVESKNHADYKLQKQGRL
ncbi:UDP-D-xylose:L-fucose alpha-1,3-D-xylosyltransferase 3 [Holothuria leucospilota]|uniref:UDP-D-xylose:L-fucose alpha-1,3-D-xylosyltransferase 3 n=1 Tax=Holothuria leucospilota TaxID=206669 RepID=A0A9Q1HJV5_HOLLE|nr:UDP-D-xylose:L-fucose alpha-1,3-D-xylosyltransferase 3 [Holothuria leucospilota]